MTLLKQGIHLISTDEMTGIQALERLFPSKPPKLKQVEKIEFEYERHGTLSLIANWDVARGKVLTPSISATRTDLLITLINILPSRLFGNLRVLKILSE